MTRTSSLMRSSSESSSTKAAFTRSVTAGNVAVSMNFPAISFLVASRARWPTYSLEKSMCGLGVLRATVCQYESKSVTQGKPERSLGSEPRTAARAYHAGVGTVRRQVPDHHLHPAYGI